jgi:5-(carboxyamino)imidazole ribonucleotide synthase
MTLRAMTPARSFSRPLAPGATVGILGGGQLGRMLALAAARLGLKSHIYSDEAQACAFQVANARTHARYDDERALEAFAAAADIVTFEFENVPGATLHFLTDHVAVAPHAEALSVAQDRVLEKSFVADLGIATAGFRAVASEEEAEAAFHALGGGPAVLKTRRLGYDGKGQKKITHAQEAAAAFASLGGVPAILETFVDFVFEASVVAARGRDGGFAAYDPPRNEHEDHILRRSSVPSPLSAANVAQATLIARRIAEALDYVGVLGVEMFIGAKGGIVVNEIAPRVHNSGHWTIEACAVSQFEQHIRAVAGWPLGDPSRHSDAVMENIIGAEADDWLGLSARPGGLHLYGKGAARPGRKMGHITRLSPLALSGKAPE